MLLVYGLLNNPPKVWGAPTLPVALGSLRASLRPWTNFHGEVPSFPSPTLHLGTTPLNTGF